MLFSERENGTLKELMVIPVSKALFVLSKFSILFVFAILFMFLSAIFTVAGAFVVGYSDMTATWILRLFEICVKAGILTAFSSLPIVFIATAAKRGYILPICATLIYSISGFIFASELVGIHPLASVAGIVWNNNIEGIEVNANLMMSVLNIAVVSMLSFMACVFVLKKQNY